MPRLRIEIVELMLKTLLFDEYLFPDRFGIFGKGKVEYGFNHGQMSFAALLYRP